jgi:hypothetical protein
MQVRTHAARAELHRMISWKQDVAIHLPSTCYSCSRVAHSAAAHRRWVADLAVHTWLRIEHTHLVAAAQLGGFVWMMPGSAPRCAKPVIHAAC